jgi:Protein of unknown function (DUF3551)
MRPTIVALILAAAFVGAPQSASAQSPYSYPWCAKYFSRVSATSCYYTSWQQCQTTLSGIGGYCFQSPCYHAGAAAQRWRS